MEHRLRLRALLVERSLTRGEFTLSSGARSSYYIDARLTTMSAEGQFLLGMVVFRTVRDRVPEADWIGGLTLGADPIAYAAAHRSWLEGEPFQAFTVRKESKAHGTGRRIEGGLPPGVPVVVVEDTLTTGASALAAVRAVQEHGARVAAVLTLVDREEGGAGRVQEAGVPLLTLFTASELLQNPSPNG